ncbi:MAG: hypothetical protein HY788_01385 [Deltaproteobacteria bacterium]|nr:hypothetical protein [Deltaproteobacteria bacterium]
MRHNLLAASALAVALMMVLSCASTPGVPDYEKQFNARVFTNVARDKVTVISAKRFGENCRIVMDPSFDSRPFEVVLSGESEKTVDLLADRGLGMMVPVMMPAYFQDASVVAEAPADGASYAFKLEIQSLKADVVEADKRVVQVEVVLSAEVSDPGGTQVVKTEGVGTGERTYAYRLYPTVELACAHALGNALNDLGRKLTTDAPQLASLLQ